MSTPSPAPLVASTTQLAPSSLAPTQKTITVVHCWSAPRSRSTALCYSFEARGADTCVALDEPLYTTWLRAQGDAVSRPYLPYLLAGTPPPSTTSNTNANSTENGDGDAVTTTDHCRWHRERLTLDERLRQAAARLPDGGVIFCKEMAKFHVVYDFGQECALDTNDNNNRHNSSSSHDVHDGSDATALALVHRHLLLLRDPVAVLSSWGAVGDVHGNNPTVQEVGIVPLLSIYAALQQRGEVANGNHNNDDNNNRTPPVVLLDSDDLATDPRDALVAVCNDLGIPFMDSMMTWKSGPHECDGPWADWWYADVHRSTGWTPQTNNMLYGGSRYRAVNPDYTTALRASYPAYQYLKSLTRRHQSRGPPPAQLYEDPRNEHVLVWIGAPGRGRIIPRDLAGVSPFDSSVQGGDAAWEGLRVYRGRILSLDQHLRRLFQSARALGFDPDTMHTRNEVVEAIFRVLAANGMRDGAHMRLTLTRGEKCTSSMNPKFNVYGTTLIILPEWKPTEGATTYDNAKGIALITASQRRNPPHTVDSKIHHNNLINNILPKIQANLAGCADAIMLDVEGFVAETNATNIFLVENGVVRTPTADHCLPGITRATVLELATELGIPTDVRRVSLAEFHAADEVFTTGTMGGLTPVVHIDGRVIGTGERGPVTVRLQELYQTLPERDGWATELPPFEA